LLVAALGAALSWAGAASVVDAQESVSLRGRVIDRETRMPIEGAIVLPAGGTRGYVTDSLGLFVLSAPAGGAYALTAEQLGYAVAEVTLASTAPEEFSTILLTPNPIAMEGLTVLVDRFEQRRRFHFGPVRVLDQAALLRRGASSAYDIVRANVPFARPCSADMNRLCVWRRGQRRTVQMCLDEAPAYGGISDLEVQSGADLYMVEVYDQGLEVRLYTRWFVEGRLRSGRGLRPLSMGC
jgi:hypothetical protein